MRQLTLFDEEELTGVKDEAPETIKDAWRKAKQDLKRNFKTLQDMNKTDLILKTVCISAVMAAGAWVLFKPLPAGDLRTTLNGQAAEDYQLAKDHKREEELDRGLYLSAAETENTFIDDQCPVPLQERCTNPESAYVEKISFDYSAADAYLLAKIAYCEAGNQGVIGQALVIKVVLNRVWSDAFPDSISDVIFEPDQFAGTQTEAWNVMDLPAESWNALELVESGDIDSQLPDWADQATYFCRSGESIWHEEALSELGVWKDHTFYTYEGGGTE